MTSIVASVGTDHHPFDRMVSWMDDVARHHPELDVFVQHGRTAGPAHADGAALIPVQDLRDRFARARVVVCHGGPATIMDAVDAGHRPIVVPRDPARGEHVDDHQQLFARRLGADGRVWLCESREAFDERLAACLADDAPQIAQTNHLERTKSIERFAALVARLEPAKDRRRRSRRGRGEGRGDTRI